MVSRLRQTRPRGTTATTMIMMMWVLSVLVSACGYHLRGFSSTEGPHFFVEQPQNESLHPTVAPLLYRELVGVFGRLSSTKQLPKLSATVREVAVRPGNGSTIIGALPDVPPGEWYAFYPVQTDTYLSVKVSFSLSKPGSSAPVLFDRVQEQSVRIFQSIGEKGAFAPTVQRSLVDKALRVLLREMVESLRTEMEVAS